MSADEKEKAKKANSVPTVTMIFPLVFYVENKEERTALYKALTGPGFSVNDKEKKVSVTKDGLKYTFSLIQDYSKVPASEVPEYLSYIKKPMIYAMKVEPAE